MNQILYVNYYHIILAHIPDIDNYGFEGSSENHKSS